MSGGTWTLNQKIRPGAYVNFSASAYWKEQAAGEGVVALPLERSWGAEHENVTVTAAVLQSNDCKKLLGYAPTDLALLPVAEALKNCKSVLVYRINDGGLKASVTLGALTVTAKYAGTRGNDIRIAVAFVNEAAEVITYLDKEEVDRQSVTAVTAPTSNDWVTFALKGTLTAAAATALSGGSNGVAELSDYNAYFTAMKTVDWQVMAIPKEDAALASAATAFIRDLRENCGKKVQGVVVDYAADYEGILSVNQGYVRDGVTVSAPVFTAWAAGATAGATAYESNTYKEVADATAIVGELAPDAIGEALMKGTFLLSRRTDGTIVVEQDINSLTTFGDQKSQVFSKNRVMRCLDRIANGIANLFEVNYIGTMNNNAAGRDLFQQDLIAFMNDLMAVGAIENFGGAEDILVAEGANADSVVVSLAVCPVDAMEKLYITVEVA